MRAGIITVPDRQMYLNPLIDVLESQGIEVKIFVDYKKQGHHYNFKRMLFDMLENAEKDEPILLCDDDMITTSDFLHRFNDIHKKAKDNLYTLFARQNHLFKPDIIKQGYITKVQKRGFYGCAAVYINQNDLPKKMFDWFEKEGRFIISKQRQNHLDVIMQDYFVHNNIPWTITIPTLFEHVGFISSLGHSIGQSKLYIGNYENI